MKHIVAVYVLLLTMAMGSWSVPHRLDLTELLSPTSDTYPIELGPEDEESQDRLMHIMKARVNEDLYPIRRLERRRFSRPHGR